MLRTGAAEGDERVLGGVAAVADGDPADGFGHAGDSDIEETAEEGLVGGWRRETVSGHAGAQFG